MEQQAKQNQTLASLAGDHDNLMQMIVSSNQASRHASEQVANFIRAQAPARNAAEAAVPNFSPDENMGDPTEKILEEMKNKLPAATFKRIKELVSYF